MYRSTSFHFHKTAAWFDNHCYRFCQICRRSSASQVQVKWVLSQMLCRMIKLFPSNNAMRYYSMSHVWTNIAVEQNDTFTEQAIHYLSSKRSIFTLQKSADVFRLSRFLHLEKKDNVQFTIHGICNGLNHFKEKNVYSCECFCNDVYSKS